MAEENAKITYQIKLDFDAIAAWRDEKNDDLPVHGMISFYRACGAADFIKEHAGEFGDQVAAIDIMSCNFYTQQRIKKFVSERWQIFSMSLLDHNKVEWNTHTFAKGSEHYARPLSKKVAKSLSYDFINYCPTLDDELPDDVLVLTVKETKPNA